MIRAAIIGLGWWGQTIVRTLQDNTQIAIRHAVDVDPAAGRFASERGIAFSSGLDAVLASDEIDAVILCTPHSQHAQQVVACSRAGKHVFCEKPLCLTRRDAAAAIDACRTNGVVLAVGHERRFEAPILDISRMARDGTLGSLLQIEANFSQDKFLGLAADNWRLSKQEAPAGPMTATGIHLLDLAVSLLGAPATVAANVGQLGSALVNGDTLGALLTFRSGANALISAILATPFCGRFAVYGSKGWVEVRDKAHPEQSEGWTMILSLRDEAVRTTEYAPHSAVLANFEAFAAAVRGEAAYPMTQEEMLWTVSALEATFRAAESGMVEVI